MPTFRDHQDRLKAFVADRGWDPVHTPKNLSMAIVTEAAELLDRFQWQDNVSPEQVKQDDELMQGLEEELADVVNNCFHLANVLDIDLGDLVEQKLAQDAEKYPADALDAHNEQLERWLRDRTLTDN